MARPTIVIFCSKCTDLTRHRLQMTPLSDPLSFLGHLVCMDCAETEYHRVEKGTTDD